MTVSTGGWRHTGHLPPLGITYHFHLHLIQQVTFNFPLDQQVTFASHWIKKATSASLYLWINRSLSPLLRSTSPNCLSLDQQIIPPLWINWSLLLPTGSKKPLFASLWINKSFIPWRIRLSYQESRNLRVGSLKRSEIMGSLSTV